MHRYFPHTDEDIARMLAACGMTSLDDLYADIPADLQLQGEYDLPDAMSEQELRDYFATLAAMNTPMDACFIGAGFYDHYSPAVALDIVRRSEFLTSYTPYQAEISQGTLQYIFEYQTMMARLTGMEVSNASMYDGTTATAEAMMMTVAAAKKRSRVLVSATVNPVVRRVMDTYAHYHGITLDTVAESGGVTDRDDLRAKLAAGDVAGVVVAQPNCYGIVEDYSGLADEIHAAKALMVMNCVASTLAVLKTPGEWGADIAVGDGQSLCVPLSYGGPYVGFLCANKPLIRKMPGRIVGATTDEHGQRAFVLTLQAREQHIRREKATSNICSNQSLMALYVTVYLSLMGPDGLREVNEAGYAGAHYLADRLVGSGKWRLAFPDKPFLNEFVVESVDGDIDRRRNAAVADGLLAGRKVDRGLMLAVTERQSRADIDRLADILTDAAGPV